MSVTFEESEQWDLMGVCYQATQTQANCIQRDLDRHPSSKRFHTLSKMFDCFVCRTLEELNAAQGLFEEWVRLESELRAIVAGLVRKHTDIRPLG